MPFDVTRRNQAAQAYNEGVMLSKTPGQNGQAPDLKMAWRLMGASVDIDPTFKEGWYGIGVAAGDMNLFSAAVAAMRRTVELDPLDVKAWVNLGHRLYHMGRHAEARHATEHALEIDPQNQYALTNLSLIESIAGNNKKSLSLARKAFEIDNQLPEEMRDAAVQLQLAFACLYAGEWAEGFKHFSIRFKYRLREHLHHPYPEWQGEEMPEGTLMLIAEQGMGDALCFSRFVPAAAQRVKTVNCYVMPELVRLFRALVQDSQNVVVMPMPPSYLPADAWTSLTSLPVALGLTNKEIEDAPWLQVPGFKLPPTWKVADRKLHIGICWAGNPENDVDRWRSIKFEQFLDLYRVPGIQLYSLQVGPEAQQLDMAGARPIVRDLQPHIRDVADTVAIMRDLDMVISIESALGWIAAQLDMECWLAYAYDGGDYRVGRNRESPLWAPRTKIFKQGTDRQWQPVFDRIVEALRERVAKL